MGARPRRDGPGARVKFTRDWEYPWALDRSRAGTGIRVLDCGAGYSPLPFLWSKRGARVSAVDRDSLIASKPAYLRWCARQFVADLSADFAAKGKRPAAPRTPADAAERRPARAGASAPRLERRGRVSRFLTFHLRRNQQRLSRLIKPDVWGPVSPRLLRRYGVGYVHADLTEMPFDAGAFDVVSCISVLEHMPEPARLAGLAEMSRVLRPGGRLIVTYDVVDGDITDALIRTSQCTPVELVYFRASRQLYAANAPDVIGLVLEKP